MDFLDPKKKRAHRIRLFIGYGLMGVALSIATLILAFVAYGYDIDRHTGGVIQNGLVIVDAHPESATILVNGSDKGGTDNRLVLPAGQYTIQLQRNGYRSWQHSVSLEGSSIEQLVYPFLFPDKLVSKTLHTYDTAPVMATESPDRHWLAMQSPTTFGAFDVTDLSNTKNPQSTVNLPADTLTAAEGAHTFEAIEWASDNTHLLLKHTFSGGAEFIMFDRDTPANSVNINKIFPSQPFTSISLRDKKADQLYLYNVVDASLTAADTKNKTLTAQLAHVLAYKSYQANTLLYTTNPSSSASEVELHVHQDNQDYLLRTLPAGKNYLLDMAQFNGHFYLVSGSTTDGRVYVYKDPFDDLNRHPARTPQPFRVLIVPGAQFVSFSAIARFIAVQGGSHFAVYDAETGRQFRYDVKLEVAVNQKATWMDGHRLMLISGDSVNIFDFDGTNLQKLSPSLPAFPPFFDRDYTAMFSVAHSLSNPAKTDVLRTDLKVLPTAATPNLVTPQPTSGY